MNQANKDFTQYSTKSSEILTNIFETLNKFKDCNNEQEKEQIYSELSENITNFELTLDNCSIDVNETISNLVKNRYDKKDRDNTNVTDINNNNNNNNQGYRMHQLINNQQMSDSELINRVVQRISNIQLNI